MRLLESIICFPLYFPLGRSMPPSVEARNRLPDVLYDSYHHSYHKKEKLE